MVYPLLRRGLAVTWSKTLRNGVPPSLKCPLFLWFVCPEFYFVFSIQIMTCSIYRMYGFVLSIRIMVLYYISGLWLCIVYSDYGFVLSIRSLVLFCLFGVWFCNIYPDYGFVISIRSMVLYCLSGVWFCNIYPEYGFVLSIWSMVL
jgi:hypothetical protein